MADGYGTGGYHPPKHDAKGEGNVSNQTHLGLPASGGTGANNPNSPISK